MSEVQFDLELLTPEMMAEMRPLLELHKDEIAHYPDIELEPDDDFYLKAQAAGMVRLFTARERDGLGRNSRGTLVGYSVFFMKQNPHYKSSLQANNDILYLDAKYRGRMLGYRFIRWCDERLAEAGVQVVYHHVKKKHNFGPMLERQGYELIDLIYGRRLDVKGE